MHQRKLQRQKIGVTKGLFELNFCFLFLLWQHLEKMMAAPSVAKQIKKIEACVQLSKVQRYQNCDRLVGSFSSRVSDLFESTEIGYYS